MMKTVNDMLEGESGFLPKVCFYGLGVGPFSVDGPPFVFGNEQLVEGGGDQCFAVLRVELGLWLPRWEIANTFAEIRQRDGD